MTLVEEVQALLHTAPDIAGLLELPSFATFPELAGALLGAITGKPQVASSVTQIYADTPELVEITQYDIAETARRNFEPGGPPVTLLSARGVHAIMAHRIAHQLWVTGDTSLALVMKSIFGRAFTADIHPAAQIGAGLWLDHGLGFVVGETAIIGDDVSIWHNVTLGSTLTDSGPHRHPHIQHGAVIGAGATLLGGITVGANANIAAGATVVQDVPPNRLVVGAKAQIKGTAQVRFTPNTNPNTTPGPDPKDTP